MVGTLIQPSFAKGEVTAELGGRVDLASYKSGLATARNVIVRPYGGIVNRPGTKFIGFTIGTNTRSRLRRFRFSSTATYILEFCAFSMRVIKNDAFVTEPPLAITGISEGGVTAFQVPGHGYSAGNAFLVDNTVIGATRFNGRWLLVGSVIDANNFVVHDPINGADLNSSSYGAYVSGGNVSRIYTIATPYAAADLPSLSFVQSADTMTISHPSYDEQKLTRSGDAAWTMTTPTFAPVAAAPSAVVVTPAAPAGASFNYAVTSIDATTGEESLPALGSTATSNTTRANTISWAAAANSALYTVYLAQNGIYGLIGTTPGLSFLDANYAPSLSVTPPTTRNPFVGVGNRPATSIYFQQRQVRGGTNNRPDTLYTSQVGNFYNLSVKTPSTDADAITATLTSTAVNAIRHFVPVKQDLLCFTAGNEWRITSNGQAFTAANIQILPQSSWGSSLLEPLLLGLTVLFTRENGLTVRSARYTYVQDAYQGEDVSLLSSHLFTPSSQVQAWATGLTPDPLVICALGSGTVACLTYQEEQQVNAWTRWDLQNGAIEDVEIVRPNLVNNVDDVPYFIVNRTINGSTNVRTIERLHSRRFTDVRDAFFVDGGLSYDNPVAITSITLGNPITIVAPNHQFGSSTTVDIFDIGWKQTFDSTGNVVVVNQLNGGRFPITLIDANTFQLTGVDGSLFVPYSSNGTARAVATFISGLDHLEGETISALCDGNAYLGLTVQNGGFTLPIPASRVHAGKQFISDIETLDLEAPQGSIQGKVKRTPFVTCRVVSSRGWLAGQDVSDLIETKLRQYENLGDPISLLTGDLIISTGSHSDTLGRVFLRQIYPLPLEVLDIIPGMEVED